MSSIIKVTTSTFVRSSQRPLFINQRKYLAVNPWFGRRFLNRVSRRTAVNNLLQTSLKASQLEDTSVWVEIKTSQY